MPRELHGELARAAEEDGRSLNQLITDTLAESVGWAGGGAEPRRPRSWSSPTLIGAALAANFAVLAVAGLAAVALLIAAWQAG